MLPGRADGRLYSCMEPSKYGAGPGGAQNSFETNRAQGREGLGLRLRALTVYIRAPKNSAAHSGSICWRSLRTIVQFPHPCFPVLPSSAGLGPPTFYAPSNSVLSQRDHLVLGSWTARFQARVRKADFNLSTLFSDGLILARYDQMLLGFIANFCVARTTCGT